MHKCYRDVSVSARFPGHVRSTLWAVPAVDDCGNLHGHVCERTQCRPVPLPACQGKRGLRRVTLACSPAPPPQPGKVTSALSCDRSPEARLLCIGSLMQFASACVERWTAVVALHLAHPHLRAPSAQLSRRSETYELVHRAACDRRSGGHVAVRQDIPDGRCDLVRCRRVYGSMLAGLAPAERARTRLKTEDVNFAGYQGVWVVATDSVRKQ